MLILILIALVGAVQLDFNPLNVSQEAGVRQWTNLNSLLVCDAQSATMPTLAVKTNSTKISATFSSVSVPASAKELQVSVRFLASAFVNNGPGAASKTNLPGTFTTMLQNVTVNTGLPDEAEYNLTAVSWSLKNISALELDTPLHLTFSAHNWGNNPRVVRVDCLQLHIEFELELELTNSTATTTTTPAMTDASVAVGVGVASGSVLLVLIPIVFVVRRCKKSRGEPAHQRGATTPAAQWESARNDPYPHVQPPMSPALHANASAAQESARNDPYAQLPISPALHQYDLMPLTSSTGAYDTHVDIHTAAGAKTYNELSLTEGLEKNRNGM